MFTELLEAQLSDIKASTVTEIFLWLLVFCLFGSLYFARKGELPRLTMYPPTLLTSLGILGTFVSLDHRRLKKKMEQSVEANVNAQLEALDQAMQQELQRVMQGMATALAQVASKFTEDYRELTASMRRIVQQGGLRQ